MDGAVTNGLYNRKQDRRHDKDQGSHLHYHSQAQQQNIDDQMSKIQDEGDQLTDTYNANYDRYLEEYTNTLVEVYTMKASMAAFA